MRDGVLPSYNDAKSGLYYYRSRYYAPAQGRFLSEDPLGGVNPYSYTGNDPVNFADPSGALAVEYGALLDSLSAQVQAGAVHLGLRRHHSYRGRCGRAGGRHSGRSRPK